MSELVPQAVRDLLAFYKEHCPGVRFGDLDIRVLDRAVESIDEAAKRVVAAELEVTEARAQFHGIESDLMAKAGRTLSFLKIFVDEDEAQMAILDAINAAMPAAGRRKGKAAASAAAAGSEPRQRRPRKSKKTEDASADDPVEAALEKAGITDDETDELDDDAASEPVAEPVQAGKKSGSKSGK